MSTYTATIRKCRFLSRQEEAEFAALAKQGDLSARSRLVESCLPWVVRMATRFAAKWGRNLEEAIQDGNIGLLMAVDRFDPNCGRLTTYAAWYIRRQMISRAMLDTTIHIPRTPAKGKYADRVQSDKERALKVVPLPDAVCSPKEEAPFDESDFQRLRENLEKLPDRWRDILLRHAQGEPLSSIGKDYDLTKERVRQIEEQALGYLRRRLDAENRLLDEVR